MVSLLTDLPSIQLMKGGVSLPALNLGGVVYDHVFYPGFDSARPATQAVLVASCRRPIQLISVSSASILSAYTAYSFTDEIVHPISLRFSPACAHILAGFPASAVRVWDVQRPGKQVQDIVFSTRKGSHEMKGIVSAVAFLDEQTFVAGTYSKRIGVFDIRDKSKCMQIGPEEEMGGVVQLEEISSSAGSLIVSGHRMDKFVRCWDLRSPDTPLMELPRVVKTQQRFQFAHVGSMLLTGDHNGDLTVFDLANDGEILWQKNLSQSPLVALAATAEGRVASGSGQRQFPSLASSDDESLDSPMKTGSLAFHRLVA